MRKSTPPLLLSPNWMQHVRRSGDWDGLRDWFGTCQNSHGFTMTSQCEPFAWWLCAADSKNPHSPQISRHMPRYFTSISSSNQFCVLLIQ
ncbi:hypothetical protein TNCV_3250831 [Trichonephila clavipes]|nr:hypothetical protein TNCV_3250831 [Trichonephila clavipes]